jgi:hypothetical protein
MLSIFDSGPASAVFVRECYITWFNLFVLAAQRKPTGKFALSSSPGCGKTFATNFIFKMATSNAFLKNRRIIYQYKKSFYLFQSDKVFQVERNAAEAAARLSDTFYVLDGHDADPVHSDCLTLFISSPRSNNFKDWHYQAQITPLYFPVWSFASVVHCAIRILTRRLSKSDTSNTAA